MKTPHRPSLLALALAAAWPVAAQQAAPAAAAAAEDDASQRVVVTASKRLEKQREVAGTVSVLSGADLERRGARDQEDILKLTPGVQFNKGDAGGNTITIRGLGTSTTNEGSGAQQGPTGQYLEDVPLASPIGKGTVYDPLTWDMDRVEILRGPQGVLFGSGSLGGAVRYLFNKPDLAAFGASLKGEYANAAQGEGAFSVYGMVNAPLQAGTVALRVVAYDRRDPGYIDNLGTKRKDANDLQQRGGRVLLTARPVKGVSATLVASSQKTEQGDTFSVSPDPGRLEHTAPNDSRRSTTTDFYSLTIDADLGGHTLTSITGHWRNKGNNLIDDTELFASVGLPLPQVYRPQTSSQKASSQELRIASNPGGSFSYVAGVFYQTSKLGSRGQQIDPSGAFGITTLVDLTGSGGGTEKAVFADTEFQLGGGWSAGAGGRYYRTTTDSTTTGTQFGAPSNVGPLESSDSGFLPRLSFKYRFGDNMWYGLASKGYRYGGRNGPPTNDEYKSDSLWSYETGVRLSPADGLQVDLALFLLDWKDAQFTFFERIGALPNSRIGNVGKARSTGLEAALKYRASAAVDLAATLAYVDATTKAAVTIPSGGPTSIAVAPGARLPGTPKLQGTLQGNLRFAGPFGSQGRASATYAHTGDRVMFLGGNKPADAYDTLDLGLQFAKGSWTLAAGLANATNEKGVLSITGAPAGVGPVAQYFLQRPLTLSVSLRYDL
ncbi:MAG: TonB-dependent receptor [Pseudomonadota bacterium]